MRRDDQITKSNLIDALKASGFTTKEDVKRIIAEEIDSRELASKRDVRNVVHQEFTSMGVATVSDVRKIVTESLGDFWQKVLEPNLATKGELRELRTGMELNLKQIHHQLDDLKANTPAKKEFVSLKRKVEQHHPSN